MIGFSHYLFHRNLWFTQDTCYISDLYVVPEMRGKGIARKLIHKVAQHAKDFGVKGAIIKVRPGPVVTLYELEPAPGTKTSRVVGLSDDIARSMSALSVRIAVVPGRSVIGIELPNL